MKTIYLTGNANVGKTTVFNAVTKSNEHTGNWHGVTVDAKHKVVEGNFGKVDVVDLPGIYSLTSYSFEEQVSIDALMKKEDFTCANIVDGNLIKRNFYLTLSLLEMGINPVVFVNFASEVESRGGKINYELLGSRLGITVKKLDKHKDKFLVDALSKTTSPKRELPYLNSLPLDKVLEILSPEQKLKLPVPQTFLATKILEQDEKILSKLNLSKEQQNKLQNLCSGEDYVSKVAELRYNYLDQVFDGVIVNEKKDFVYGKDTLDKFVLNKFLALPIFLLLLFIMFYLTFSSVGELLSDGLGFVIENYVGVPLVNLLKSIGSPRWIVELFSNCILTCVAGLFSFIPQIVIMFLCLSILEDSGYMSRLAFSFEDIFYKFGLSGKSIFTILLSFGCATSAVMTSRNIEDKNTKIKTAIVSPYMSCSAKLPIYAVIGGAFFGRGNIFVIILLYIIGIVAGLFVSSMLGKKMLKSGERSFILEFPPYRLPNFKRVMYIVYSNCKAFVEKVATILLSFSVIVWVLQNFSFTFKFLPQIDFAEKSMLQVVCEKLEFIFAPLGLNNWGIVASLIVGIMAKEMVVSTMSIINKTANATNFNTTLGLSLLGGSVISFSPTTAIVMMVFSLLYAPCISTLAVMKKEIGLKWTLFAFAVQFAFSYFVCFILYQFLTGGVLVKVILSVAVLAFITLLFVKSYKKTKKQGVCGLNCQSCQKCFL